MCGIFGIISKNSVNRSSLKLLGYHARQRGYDSSGLIFNELKTCYVKRADFDIKKLLNNVKPNNSSFVFGHSRLITNGLDDNQPVQRKDILVIHNGIIVNDNQVWKTMKVKRFHKIDSEIIAAITDKHISEGKNLSDLHKSILNKCKGTISTAIILPKLGKVILFSNNGSLYFGQKHETTYFCSEEYPLKKLSCEKILQIKNKSLIFDISLCNEINISDHNLRKENLIPEFKFIKSEEKLLEYNESSLKRCTKCILTETMPYIKFDETGVCNYCQNYKKRNIPKPKKELFELVAPYRRKNELDCIIPFSGGRDSCYGLHLIVNELEMKPITYTYDWGMVTDLGRRNISRMCSKLGIENIIIAADISKKRRNIRLNLQSWLKSPHLGMLALLTAGDKHFFRHVETVKKQTNIKLNLWGINPLEVTHFKTGFLNIAPDFEEKKVYSHGILNQINYHYKRTRAMMESPGYFNRSLFDTLSGEYFRSFTEKKDYFHIFDYWRWDEERINKTLLNKYNWETASDTSTTWRIGDGTAAFYNYIYYTVAGFTEHDTFRSNQIREGDISRDYALKLVKEENKPRYQNIRWYLDTLELDYVDVIKIVNSIPKLYKCNI